MDFLVVMAMTKTKEVSMLSHIQGFATTAKSSRLKMLLLIIRHVHVNHVTQNVPTSR